MYLPQPDEFLLKNDRRTVLLNKKYFGGPLTSEENQELEVLTNWIDERIGSRFRAQVEEIKKFLKEHEE